MGKKIWNIIYTVVVVLFVIAAVALMGAKVIGLQTYSIISGSMEPTYSKGDLVYVKIGSPEAIKTGDVITFVLNEQLQVATHRVYSVDSANQRFYTKGDANENPDATPVLFRNFIGTPVFSIPYLGYVADWVQSSPGMYIAIAVGVVLLLAVFLPDLLKKKKPAADTEETEQENEAEIPIADAGETEPVPREVLQSTTEEGNEP